MSSERMKKLEASGLIGCLNETGVTSENYKDQLPEPPQSPMYVKFARKVFDGRTGNVYDLGERGKEE